jgi:hypothetical protein
MVAKALFLCNGARPDIQPTITVICMRVKDPNEADWAKLVRLMKYLNGTMRLKLTLSADNLHCIKWYVDILIIGVTLVPLCHMEMAVAP